MEFSYGDYKTTQALQSTILTVDCTFAKFISPRLLANKIGELITGLIDSKFIPSALTDLQFVFDNDYDQIVVNNKKHKNDTSVNSIVDNIKLVTTDNFNYIIEGPKKYLSLIIDTLECKINSKHETNDMPELPIVHLIYQAFGQYDVDHIINQLASYGFILDKQIDDLFYISGPLMNSNVYLDGCRPSDTSDIHHKRVALAVNYGMGL